MINIKKVKVTTKKRQLSPKYTLEVSQDVISEIDDDIQMEITRLVDDDILANIILAQGWHGVTLNTDAIHDVVVTWCKNNCCDRYYVFHHMCVFRKVEDAMLFQMVWL
jgi:hypothetical protein